MPTIGSFTLIKDEKYFIRKHLAAWLPVLDRMVFYDGNSTDGTLEIIKDFRRYNENGKKIILLENKDPKDLQGDYTRLSNEAMWDCQTDLAMFLHPDMFPCNGDEFRKIPDNAIAVAVSMQSFAGEPYGDLFKVKGRGQWWKNIYRLNNPNLGAHYFGHYGAQNEDTYFKEITGDEHYHYGQDMERYPYDVVKSNIVIRHYSDVRPYSRRLDRMTKCLMNQGYSKEDADILAPQHPRVSLKSGGGFEFEKIEMED